MDENVLSKMDKVALGTLIADGMMGSHLTQITLLKSRADRSFTAVIAGSDTTATALSQLWYFLVKNPHYYETLRQEVLSDVEGDFTRQASMPYLNACMWVILRALFSSFDADAYTAMRLSDYTRR